ncbi:MAG: DUF2807 domain-containing protein [Crocinitomicaceae bacterium]
MKLLSLSLITATVFLSACNFQNNIIPSKEIVKFEVPIDNINAIDASGIYKIGIRLGTEEKLMIRCNENLQEYLNIADEGTEVSFDMDNVSSSSEITLEAYLTVTDLKSVNCSGAVKVNLENGKYNDVEFDLSGVSSVKGKEILAENINIDGSGASLFEVSALNTKEIALDFSGASNAMLGGNSSFLKADFSGASHLKASEFNVSEKAEISASGASGLKIKVRGSIRAEMSGASHLVYSGTPTKVTKSVSGAASVSSD